MRDFEVRIKTEEESSHGHHKAIVRIECLFDNDSRRSYGPIPDYIQNVRAALSDAFGRKVEHRYEHGEENGESWVPLRHCLYMAFSHFASKKPEAISAATLLGTLTVKHGSLDKKAEKVVAEALRRQEYLDRAEELYKEYKHVFSQVASSVEKAAKEEIGFEQRVNELLADLRTAMSEKLKQRLANDDAWFFKTEGEEKTPIDPDVRSLIAGHQTEVIESRMSSAFGRGLRLSFSDDERNDEPKVVLLAAVLEGRDQ